MDYQHPQIRPYNKGERRDPWILPTFCFERDGKVWSVLYTDTVEDFIIGTAKVTSKFDLPSPHTKTAIQPAERLEVFLYIGWVVPAWRLISPTNSMNICQSTEHKAVNLCRSFTR